VFDSCNNVAPVTNLCLGRATTRSHSSQWSKKKICSWNVKTHYLRFKHFIITITENPCLLNSLNILNFVIYGLTIWMSIPYLAIKAWIFTSAVVNIVVKNTIFRKAPPSVVSGYDKQSTGVRNSVSERKKSRRLLHYV
jgi:hypothetical protein